MQDLRNQMLSTEAGMIDFEPLWLTTNSDKCETDTGWRFSNAFQLNNWAVKLYS